MTKAEFYKMYLKRKQALEKKKENEVLSYVIQSCQRMKTKRRK